MTYPIPLDALTIALLLICLVLVGVVYLVHRFIQSQVYVEVLASEILNKAIRLNGVVGEYLISGDIHHQALLNRVEDFHVDHKNFTEDLASALSTEATSVVEAITANVREDGKKTRKDLQEVKTHLADEEAEDQRDKAMARRAASTPKKPSASK